MPAPGPLRRVLVDTPAGPVVARVPAAAGDRAILLIHGAAGSWTTWLPLLEAARAAGRPLTGAVAVDLPGWGESPDPVGPFGAEEAAAVLTSVLLELGFRRWVVAGHSLGGFVALALAAREPDRTEGVLLVSPTGPAVLAAIRRPVIGGLRLPWFAGMLVAMRALAALPDGGRRVLGVLGRLSAFGPLARPLFARPVPPEVAAALTSEIRPGAFVRAARAASASDLESWRRITCPVRSLRGLRDVFAGPGDAAAFARRIPDLAETVLPDAGHFATAERPDAVLAALGALLHTTDAAEERPSQP